VINPKSDVDDFYDVASVASYFKCSVRTIRRWVAKGLLATIKPSGKLLITRQSVQTLVSGSPGSRQIFYQQRQLPEPKNIDPVKQLKTQAS